MSPPIPALCLCCLSSCLHPLLYPFLQDFLLPVLPFSKNSSGGHLSEEVLFPWNLSLGKHTPTLTPWVFETGGNFGTRDAGDVSEGLSVERQASPPQTAAVQQAGVQLWDKRIRVTQPAEWSPTEGGDGGKGRTASGAQVAEHRLPIIGSFWCP